MAEDRPGDEAPKRHFSLLRTLVLADLLTLGNAACGTMAIFMCLKGLDLNAPVFIWTAFALIPVALVLDILDGFVARWRRRKSYLGADLDSLADSISFGVAPAVLGYTLGMRGGWDVLVLVLFVTAGIARLARYNATLDDLSGEGGKVRYYEGLPIPSSVLLVAVLAVAFATDAVGARLWFGSVELLGTPLHPLVLVYLLSGCAMVSATLRIPKP